VAVAVRSSIDQVPGWDDLLGEDGTFYLSRAWLGFADSDGEADARYCLAGDPARPLAGLVAHWSPGETNPMYVPSQQLPFLPEDAALLTLGGRRGYLSAVLARDRAVADRAVPELIEAAVEAFGARAEGWWWPYLDTSATQQVIEALDGHARPRVTLIDADCELRVVGAGIDDHVHALPERQRRRNFRHEMNVFAASGLVITRERLKDCWQQAGQLLSNVQRKYGHDNPPSQMAEVLRRQAELLDDRAVVFACRDNGELIGFSLAYRWRTELALRAVGFDYQRLRGACEYAQLVIHSPLQLCYEEGLRRIHLGGASLAAKCRRGAVVRPLWALYDCARATPDEAHLAEVAHSQRERLQALAQELPSREAPAFLGEVSELRLRIQDRRTLQHCSQKWPVAGLA
jgi:hypothetical protein